MSTKVAALRLDTLLKQGVPALLCGIGIFLVLGGYFASRIPMSTFSSEYHPKGAFAVHLFWSAYILTAYRLRARSSRRARWHWTVAALSVLTLGAISYGAYHAYYLRSVPAPEVSAFLSFEKVMPYHEQLAFPAFTALLIAPLLLAPWCKATEPASHAFRRRTGKT